MALYVTEVMADSPVGYWGLEDTSGTTAVDSSGNGRNGTYTNSPVLLQPGPKSGAYAVNFDGSNDYVEIADNAAFEFTSGNFSVEAWVKFDSTPTSGELIVGKWVGGGFEWLMYVDASLGIGFSIMSTASPTDWLTAEGAVLSTATWYHVVVTLSGTTLTVYVDGSSYATDSTVTGSRYSSGTTTPVTIGARTGGGSAVDAHIAHVSIYNTALSSGRVSAHYAGTWNEAPTIVITSPADASSTTDDTPDFVFAVTDPDASQTLTVTVEIYSDAGLTTLVQTRTNTTSTPASSAAVTVTATALTRNATYYWRAKVSDGTATSSWTTARSFTLYYSNPTCTITAPADAGSVTTGGPNLTVSWNYAQAESQAQATYRVRLLNDAGSTTYYDSGTISSASTSVAIDLVTQGVPTDTTDIKATVDLTTTGAQTAGTDTNAFDVLWGVVTSTITSPTDGAVTTDSTPTLTWTFSSTRSKTQTHYRVRALITSTGAVHSDSAKTASTSATTYDLPVLTDNTRYTIELTLWNNEGISG